MVVCTCAELVMVAEEQLFTVASIVIIAFEALLIVPMVQIPVPELYDPVPEEVT